ncbi:MAG: response regulator transcription factor [Chitinophagales bacterium]
MTQTNPIASLLLVDDDPGIIDFISLGFKYEGYQVNSALTGLEALDIIRSAPPDLVVLDWMLPDIQGPEMCQRIRSLTNAVILMLTAKDELVDRVHGLRSGADDYLVKPFHFDELLARVEALLRRSGRTSLNDTLHFDDLTLYPSRHEAFRGTRRLNLTPTEFDLLDLFMRHPHQVLSKETLIQNVWGFDFHGETNVVEVYVGYLRRKLGEPPLIQTIRGVGYVLEESER